MSTGRRRLRVSALVPAGLVIGLAVLAGCGGSAAPMSDHAATELHDRVAAVENAVAARDASAAQQALDDLRSSVDRFRQSDGLSDARAADILAAASAVDDQLASITTTTTTTTTTIVTEPPPTAPQPAGPRTPAQPPDDKNKDKGKDKGKGGGPGPH